MKGEILYSVYEDDWLGCDESPEEIAELALSDYDQHQISQMETVTIYKGVTKQQVFEQFFDVDSMLERINENAYETCGECADDYLLHVSDAQKEELLQLITSWVNKHNLNPSFFMIEDIEEVEFNLRDLDL
ncbi:hypothetical protein vBVpaMR16F_258 [Vibrio phage vB_VpaM_R16F]|nr:hypothetical protein vBVpaMR16F_258 [Vibrio phage vB_VpaM_R16F]